jgi:hypothetical protein
MQRTTLAIAALTAGTAACLAVMVALREPPLDVPAPTPPAAASPAPTGPVASAPPQAAPPPVPQHEVDLLAAMARSAQAHEQALRDAIVRIGEDEALPLRPRLDRYREAVEAARQATPTAALMDPAMTVEVFLRMEGVQRELAALGPSARAGELAHIRRELGFDDAAIARAEALDERREARWQNGLAYMQDRARIVSSFEGDARGAELRALRSQYFGDTAATIEAEEQQGFFRFERPRIYGRN